MPRCPFNVSALPISGNVFVDLGNEVAGKQQVPRRPEGGLARDDNLKQGPKPDEAAVVPYAEEDAASRAPTKRNAEGMSRHLLTRQLRQFFQSHKFPDWP